MTILTTPRLRLEPMTDAHLDGLFEMNRDPEVMRYITGKPDTLADTQAMIDRVKKRWGDWGFSWWTFFEVETGEIVGAGCIQHLRGETTNPHEIGWRLRRDRWSQGYGSEAARRMAAFAFDKLAAPEIVAVCEPDNDGSVHIMKKLGMSYRETQRWHETDIAVYGMTVDEWRRSPSAAKAAQEMSKAPRGV